MTAQAMNVMRRFHNAFAHRRVCVDRIAELPGCQFILYSYGGFSDHLRGIGTQDVASQDLVGFRVCDQLYKPVGTVHSQAASVSGKVELTGNLRDLMKESARAAITYIRSRADKLGIDPDFYKTKDIHIHFPEAAVPKDGPSAGITMCIALISALSGRPVCADVAMTGEISLRGRVLPIGGLREKTMAALRAGVKTVIIPKENEPDLEEIDQLVRKKLNFVAVGHADEVLELVFPPEKAEKELPSHPRKRRSTHVASSPAVRI